MLFVCIFLLLSDFTTVSVTLGIEPLAAMLPVELLSMEEPVERLLMFLFLSAVQAQKRMIQKMHATVIFFNFIAPSHASSEQPSISSLP